MNRTERCVYQARLAVAAYHYFLQGKPREQVKLHWHGDETQQEIDFVTQVIQRSYADAESDQRNEPKQPLSQQSFGDRAYQSCMAAPSE